MPVKSISVLKSYFETGDRPTESQFADLIDSFIHKQTGGLTVVANSYDAETGDVYFSFSDTSTLEFNIKGNANEPISFITGLQTALDSKVNTVAGKGLSANDFTNELKTKLDGLSNYVPSTSEEIAFINGLQAALDAKADDYVVIKTITINGDTQSPDAEGNVDFTVAGGGAVTPPTVVTTLPAEIIVDGTKVYHVTNGTIKPADQSAAHIEGTDIEVISKPADGDGLYIDLTQYPYVQLQGGGFSESPAGYFTLETDEGAGLLKEHLTLLMWRRGNLYISNSMNFKPVIAIEYLTVGNVTNDYVDIVFNKPIIASDLVIGNFSKTFTQNGDTATDVTLDSITDAVGAAISGNTNHIRIYFTITGTTDGSATFTITAASLTDIYTNNETLKETPNILLNDETVADAIAELSNVIAYWKEGEGDNTTGTATKTDIKNSKVLSAAGEGNPTLSGTEWIFDGVNDGFRLVDSAINALINIDAKDFQIHYVGNFKANGTRIVAATKTGFTGTSAWSFAFNNAGDILFGSQDNTPDFTNNTIIPTIAAAGTNYSISLKFHQKDLGSGVVSALDAHVKRAGFSEVSVLDIDLSLINVSEVSELFIGMRETTTKVFYNVGFKSLVIANSSANFDTIKTALAL